MKKESLKDVAKQLVAGYLHSNMYADYDEEIDSRKNFISFLCDLEIYHIIPNEVAEIIMDDTNIRKCYNYFAEKYTYDIHYINACCTHTEEKIDELNLEEE